MFVGKYGMAGVISDLMREGIQWELYRFEEIPDYMVLYLYMLVIADADLPRVEHILGMELKIATDMRWAQVLRADGDVIAQQGMCEGYWRIATRSAADYAMERKRFITVSI